MRAFAAGVRRWSPAAATVIIMLVGPLSAQTEPSEAQVLQKMLDLLARDSRTQQEACLWLAEQKSIGVVPALVDALYFVELPQEWEWAMGKLTGKSYGRDWARWMEWLGQQEFELHPAYAQFKFRLFSRIDAGMGHFLRPDQPRTIRIDEIVWGGVRKDGIPSLDHPKMLTAGEATYLNDSDDVFGLVAGDEAHAYPLRILNWHEMLNTTIAGESITITYCTLCGAAVPYRTTLGDTTFVFGTSGLLYRSNKLMYDRQTGSLWSSLHGEPVVGPLVGRDLQLPRYYLVRTTWQAWRRQHPKTLVLDIATGHERDYSPGAAYNDYFKNDKTMFPVAWRDKRLKAKDWIFGLLIAGAPRAYPLKELRKAPVLNDTHAGESVLLLADSERLTVRAYASGSHRFRAGDTPEELLDETGHIWRVTEHALIKSTNDATLPRLPGHLAYWFGWYAFFPQTTVWQR